MTAQNHMLQPLSVSDDCRACHQPLMSTSPFWNYQAAAGEDRQITLSISAAAPERAQAGNVSSISARFDIVPNGSTVLTKVGNAFIGGDGRWSQIVRTGQAGTAHVSARLVMNYTNGSSQDMISASHAVTVSNPATAISGVSCAPNPVPGGDPTTCTVALNGTSNGSFSYTAQEFSDPPNINALSLSPATFSVPSGQSSHNFTVPTNPLPASYNGQTYNAQVRVSKVGVPAYSNHYIMVSKETPTGGTGGAVTFNSHLRATFKHDRCVKCHEPDFPTGHPSVAADVNCANCHGNLPAGSHPVPWHFAPASMRFAGKTDAQLCQMAKNFGTVASSVSDHLTGDPLILWAVSSGQITGAAAKPTAPPHSISTWNNYVSQWIAAGMPCN